DSHDRQQGRSKDLLLAQRLSRWIEGSSRQAPPREQAGLDGPRSHSRYVAEEQVARAPCQEIACLPRRRRFGAARGAEAATDFALSLVPAGPGSDSGFPHVGVPF